MTIQQAVDARIPTKIGEFRLYLFRFDDDEKEHLALVMGDLAQSPHPLVRIHSECFTGDVLGSLRCDCGPQLAQAMKLIAHEGVGAILYLRQEGRGIGLWDKLRAYNLQDQGYDTVEANLMLGHQADARDYTVAARMLAHLNVPSLRLLTNNPAKVESLQALDVHVAAREPLVSPIHHENLAYLQTKIKRMRHLLTLDHANGSLLAQNRNGNGFHHQINGSNGSAPVLSKTLKQSLLPSTSSTAYPFVTLTYAQSLDGSIAARRGEPMALSGPESLVMTHHLRANHDAILVGICTILADNPRLNVRLVPGKAPQPVILDSQLRFPLEAKVLTSHESVWVVTTEGASWSRQQALEALGVQVLRLPANQSGQVSLGALLPALKERGIQHVMVEGGAKVITSFLAARLVNRLVLTIVPILVGGLNAVHCLPQMPHHNQNYHFPRLQNPQYEKLGQDLLLFGDVE